MLDKRHQFGASQREYSCPLHFPGVFGRKQCQDIISAGLAEPVEEGLVSSGVDGNDSADAVTRIAEIAWLPPEGHTRWIFDKLQKVVERANRTYQFDISGFTEDAQFTCYRQTGAFYDWHQDGLEGELAVRKLSLVVQLSDPEDYIGSELELFSLASDETVADAWREDLRRQGSVIAFPAFEHHRVTPLIEGERYSLVCWVGGPPFR